MSDPYATSSAKRPAMARKRTSEKGVETSSNAGSPSDSQDDAKQKTRARINMACIHCRHRKIKCDGTQPACATCVRLRRQCEYEPVTEIENLMSRERKRRNKEKKAARTASLGIFAGQTPLSMLHPIGYSLPAAPLAHYADLSQADLTPLFLSSPELGVPPHGHFVESEFGPRRRRGISMTQPAPRLSGFSTLEMGASFQMSSVSQPPTPQQGHRFFPSHVSSPLDAPVPPLDYLSTTPSSSSMVGGFAPLASPSHPPASQPQYQQHQPPQPTPLDLIGLNGPSMSGPYQGGPASASAADFDIGVVNLSELPTVVPTSAHVRPIDLPAPHGHFDFASLPFPTQDCFLAEVPFTSLRRRSSIHLPVGQADQFRRPSIAEVATAALMQRVSGKRAEKVNKDTKQVADGLLSDSSDIMAWNANVQSSQLSGSLASWSGFGAVPEQPTYAGDASSYISPDTPTARSNSDGLLSFVPLSPPDAAVSSGLPGAQSTVDGTSSASLSSVSSTNGDSAGTIEAPALDASYFSPGTGKISREASPFSLSSASVSAPSSTVIVQNGWAAFQTVGAPLLSPVSDLNNSFNNFSVFGAPS
ncbi:hypothetical protein BCV70DRAFT_140364, partial [Testicularia cyperi]